MTDVSGDDMTKKDQLKKNRKPNPKKLSRPENEAYRCTIDEISFGKCQLCGTIGQDYHHPYYGNRGADKDDRYQLAVCRTCHTECHRSKHGAMNTKAKGIAEENWGVHNGK